jgi:hypothetical protein
MPGTAGFRVLEGTIRLRKPQKYEVMLPQILELAEAGADVVRDALYRHRTTKQPPRCVDGRRRQLRQPGQPFVPKYRKSATEVDRRRKAGEGFDRLAREMKVSRGTVVRA